LEASLEPSQITDRPKNLDLTLHTLHLQEAYHSLHQLHPVGLPTTLRRSNTEGADPSYTCRIKHLEQTEEPCKSIGPASESPASTKEPATTATGLHTKGRTTYSPNTAIARKLRPRYFTENSPYKETTTQQDGEKPPRSPNNSNTKSGLGTTPKISNKTKSKRKKKGGTQQRPSTNEARA
jgi:hypothetical protein